MTTEEEKIIKADFMMVNKLLYMKSVILSGPMTGIRKEFIKNLDMGIELLSVDRPESEFVAMGVKVAELGQKINDELNKTK